MTFPATMPSSSTLFCNPMGTPKNNAGFSILEIMVSLAVMAVLSTIAIPAISDIYDRNRTKTAAVLFQDNLRQARYESKIHTTASVSFCAVKADYAKKTTCVTNDNIVRFRNGWQWFVDINGNGVYDLADGDRLLGNTYESADNGLNIVASARIENNTINYTNGKAHIQKANATDLDPITPFVTFTNKSGGTSTVYFDLTGRSTLVHIL